ncbi:hypothetical protein BpHYR1_021737 [Brachionus plicatilis]|uniref:Uncharacterized protein n=1 Tax=Brachionus plicatilis TaxID=10195 RepID=A0A3M7RX27_BRAPC|nr:hypothetical protein BpHYR1_021737 [Brachionus plicatilis]
MVMTGMTHRINKFYCEDSVFLEWNIGEIELRQGEKKSKIGSSGLIVAKISTIYVQIFIKLDKILIILIIILKNKSHRNSVLFIGDFVRNSGQKNYDDNEKSNIIKEF